MKAVRAARLARSLASVSAWFLLAALTGCGGASNKTHLTGKVIYKDAPVTGGTIKLYSSPENPFTIQIKPDGTFDVEDAPPGEMKVAIETDSVFVPPPAPAGSSAAQATANMPKKVKIPAKYNKPDTSGVTWNTTTEKTKTFDLGS
jgi:hypothetical protein